MEDSFIPKMKFSANYFVCLRSQLSSCWKPTTPRQVNEIPGLITKYVTITYHSIIELNKSSKTDCLSNESLVKEFGALSFKVPFTSTCLLQLYRTMKYASLVLFNLLWGRKHEVILRLHFT